MSDADAWARAAAVNGQPLQAHPPPPDYAFTEITTFHIAPELAIENAQSEAGTLWARTVREYVEEPGTGLLWWGRMLEDLGRVKLVVDWVDKEQHHLFQKSARFKALREAWGEAVEVEGSAYYVFSDYANDRRNAFTKTPSWAGDVVTAILTFRLSTPLRPVEKVEWDIAWEQFSWATLQSEGGGASSKTCAGWALDGASFCGVVRYMGVASMKRFLASGEEKEGEEATLPLGLRKMRELAGSEGMEVEFASMYCLEDGWLGGVTMVRRENPQVTKMFEEARKWHRKVGDEMNSAGQGDIAG